MTKTGLFCLVQKMRTNSHLHKLTIDFNNLEMNLPFYIIGKLLSSGCKLKVFRARYCRLDDNFGIQFGENLSKSKNLLEVDLSHNLLSSGTFKAISNSVKLNTSRL
jgi:Leucine-rich repeat (LRR) protein